MFFAYVVNVSCDGIGSAHRLVYLRFLILGSVGGISYTGIGIGTTLVVSTCGNSGPAPESASLLLRVEVLQPNSLQAFGVKRFAQTCVC